MLLSLLVAVPAFAQGVERPRSVQLDSDGDRETLVPKVKRDRYGFAQRQAVVRDPGCRSRVIMGPHDVMATLAARELDGQTAWREVLVEGRDGASSRAGVTRIVRLDHRSDSLPSCNRVRVLFSYSTADPKPGPPVGYYVANYGVRVARRRVEVFESLARDGRPAVTARESRTRTWVYSSSADRFVYRATNYACGVDNPCE